MSCNLPLPATATAHGLVFTAATPGNLSAFVRAYHARRPRLTRAQAARRACWLLARASYTGRRDWLGRYADGLTFNAMCIAGNVGAGHRARG